MFVAFHSDAYFSLGDEVLLYFVLCVKFVRSSNLNLNQNGLNL
jgi:hypothetical protein